LNHSDQQRHPIRLPGKSGKVTATPKQSPSTKTIASDLDFSDLLFTDMGLLVRMPKKMMPVEDAGTVRDDGWFLHVKAYAWAERGQTQSKLKEEI
jgi:hypothetical protein